MYFVSSLLFITWYSSKYKFWSKNIRNWLIKYKIEDWYENYVIHVKVK